MSNQEIIGFDCGTTNWRLFLLGYTEEGGVRRPVGQPLPVNLTVFQDGHLPAALLLDEAGQILNYGRNAYQEACGDPDRRGGLRDGFKLCVGNRDSLDPLSPRRRYSHDQALEYTRQLLAKVVERLQTERPTSFDSGNLFYFAHPVHWGQEAAGGAIEGELLSVFAAMVRSCFPAAVRERVHFVREPEAALLNLAQSGQVQLDRMTLVVDVGGGTTDLAAGLWTGEGFREPRYGGGPHGSGLYDHDLARFLADRLNIPEALRAGLWTELCERGKELKERLSRQISMNPDQPVTLNVTIPMPDGAPPYYGKIKLDRATFENETQATSAKFNDLVLKTLLREIKLTVDDIQQVVLVGGGANLYLVPQLLNELFEGKAPVIYGSPPEDAIVAGAVWRAISRAKSEPLPKPVPKPIDKDKPGPAKELRITLHKTYQYTDAVNSVAFSPDSRLLAAACGGGRLLFGSDNAVCVWRTGETGTVHILTGHARVIVCVAFSPDGEWLASGSVDKTVRLWRVVTGTPVRTLSGHTDKVGSVAFSPDGEWLASGSRDKTVRLWRVVDGMLVRTLTGATDEIFSMAFSPDGTWLAAGTSDGEIAWRVRDGTFEKGGITRASLGVGLRAFAWAPDFSVRACTVYHIPDIGLTHANGITLCLETEIGHDVKVDTLAFSPDSEWLASGSKNEGGGSWGWDNAVRLWRVADGSLVRRLNGPGWLNINSVVFSPNGEWLASGSDDKTVRLWKIEKS